MSYNFVSLHVTEESYEHKMRNSVVIRKRNGLRINKTLSLELTKRFGSDYRVHLYVDYENRVGAIMPPREGGKGYLIGGNRYINPAALPELLNLVGEYPVVSLEENGVVILRPRPEGEAVPKSMLPRRSRYS